MDKTLQMIFVNANGGRVTISLPEPREDVTEQDVSTVMALIINKAAFVSTGGALVSSAGARIVGRSVEPIFG